MELKTDEWIFLLFWISWNFPQLVVMCFSLERRDDEYTISWPMYFYFIGWEFLRGHCWCVQRVSLCQILSSRSAPCCIPPLRQDNENGKMQGKTKKKLRKKKPPACPKKKIIHQVHPALGAQRIFRECTMNPISPEAWEAVRGRHVRQPTTPWHDFVLPSCKSQWVWPQQWSWPNRKNQSSHHSASAWLQIHKMTRCSFCRVEGRSQRQLWELLRWRGKWSASRKPWGKE